MKGVIIFNTGSPTTRTKDAVKEFIGDMLSDPLVMTVPDWMREKLARKIIAPLRASKSLGHYSLIWDYNNDSSPLIYHTKKLAEKIEAETDMPVEIAMRYGPYSFDKALDNLYKKNSNLHEVIIVPMFPQYAQSSYQTVVDEIGRVFYKTPYPFRLKILKPYFEEPEYIEALAESLRPFVEKPYDRLIFSFHSLPLSHEEAGRKKGKQFDYVYQIKETIKLVSKRLKIDPNKNKIVFSSAMGRKWIAPSLTETMKLLPSEGGKKIIIITPGFPADNLETLFDIDIEARDIFMKHGGEEFNFVTSLNSEDYWVTEIIKMITRNS